MKRWAAVLGLLAVVAFLSACSGSSPTRPGPFASQADQVVADLAARNFTAVEAKFDPTMKALLTLPLLQNAWTGYQKLLGSYRSHSAPTFARVGQNDVERVPVTMAHGQGEVRISFHPDGTMAGLAFTAPPP
jgi:hypothetical protein